jgi:hypothetical protein
VADFAVVTIILLPQQRRADRSKSSGKQDGHAKVLTKNRKAGLYIPNEIRSSEQKDQRETEG